MALPKPNIVGHRSPVQVPKLPGARKSPNDSNGNNDCALAIDFDHNTKSDQAGPFYKPCCSSPPEFVQFQRTIANKLGHFAITLTSFNRDSFGNYSVQKTSTLLHFWFWGFVINNCIKAIFLCFLVIEYFGPIGFLDKIAALDYILCFTLGALGTLIWSYTYPLHEILHAFWKLENCVYLKLGCPAPLRTKVDQAHRKTVWIQLIVEFVGCSCLAIQFYADPKYCGYTYSAFTKDTWWLRVIFCLHEFFFILNAWNGVATVSSLNCFQGISLSNLLQQMTMTLKQHGKPGPKLILHGKKLAVPGMKRYSVEQLISHYKQFSLLADRFNEWVAYKILAMHICCYCQFTSDVFVGIHILKDGGGFFDVWFYLEDCLAGILTIYRVYTFMSYVSESSRVFLHELSLHLKCCTPTNRRALLRVTKSLKVISLKLGPIDVTPITVLTAMNTFGNYYVVVALW